MSRSQTIFTDLPDLAFLHVFQYLSPFDAIQSFYDLEPRTDRFLELLIEHKCFANVHHLRFPLFNFVCTNVFPRLGEKLRHLTLNNDQFQLAADNEILSYLPNLVSLNLLNILEIAEEKNSLDYFLCEQLENLAIEFLCEHHHDAEAFVCEYFLFNKRSKNLRRCQVKTSFGVQLRRLHLNLNTSLTYLTIQLKNLDDLHLLFDYLLNIETLNVELCQWTNEETKYDYRKLKERLRCLTEFSLKSEHILSFQRVLLLLQSLNHVKKFSLIYRNYDESGIDIGRFQQVLSSCANLHELRLFIKFIFFRFNAKFTFEHFPTLKYQWNIYTYFNIPTKTYFAYTTPLIQSNYSITTDFLLENSSPFLSNTKHLRLTTHQKQVSLFPLIQQLEEKFPSLTSFHLIDSFGVEEGPEDGDEGFQQFQLSNISTFDASDVRIAHVFEIFYRSMNNLSELHLAVDLFKQCHSTTLFRGNSIKTLELFTNQLHQIVDILGCFPRIEQLLVNTKKQSTPLKRTFYAVALNWFLPCLYLHRIHIKTHRLADIFHATRLENDRNMFVQYSIEMLTLWR